jgi:hypothetical protein
MRLGHLHSTDTRSRHSKDHRDAVARCSIVLQLTFHQ